MAHFEVEPLHPAEVVADNVDALRKMERVTLEGETPT